MGLWRYEPNELPVAVSRTVRWRWPGERLLLTVPCEAEWPVVREEWSPEHWTGTGRHDLAEVDENHVEPGALGVTEARLVYQNQDRPDVSPRVAAGIFAALAATGFLIQDGTMTSIAGALAVVLWGASRAVGAFGLGGASIEFGRILDFDRVARRIHGIDRWGIHYRLRLAEDDLDRVANVVFG